jgi:hypothetical protein
MSAFAGRLQSFLHWACAALALYFTACFIFIALQTLNYPFHIEWMEGQVIDVIQRVRDGLPLYAKPSIEYVSYAYTPYFYYVGAFVSLFTGVDFIAGRLVSFTAALATGWLIYHWLRREGCSLQAGIIGAGCYYATYIMSGRWMDVSRVDSLFLCFSLYGIYMFYYTRGWQNMLCTVALMTAAYFTKQTAVLILIPCFGAMLLLDPKHCLLTGIVLSIVVGIISLIGHVTTDGWFTFFVYEISSYHTIQWQYLYSFWTKDLFKSIGGMMVIAALLLPWLLLKDWRKAVWFGSMLAGLVGCSYAARLNWGGYINVLMPACAGFAFITGLSLLYASRISPWFSGVLALVVSAQLAWLFYDPFRYIPSQESVDQGNKFLEEIAKLPGDVFMPEVQFVQTRVGKKSFTMGMAALDVFYTDMKAKNTVKQALLEEIKQAIASRRFGAVIPGGVVPAPGVAKQYQFSHTLRYPKEYVTVTRNFLKRDVYLPIPQASTPVGAQ